MPLAARTDLPTLKRWLGRWISVRHREAAERTILTAITGGASPAELAALLFSAETDRAYADGGTVGTLGSTTSFLTSVSYAQLVSALSADAKTVTMLW